MVILPIDRWTISNRIEELLQQHEPIASQQFKADDTVEAMLFALQQVVGEVEITV